MGSVLQGALLQSSLPKGPQALASVLLRVPPRVAWHGLFVCNKDNSPF